MESQRLSGYVDVNPGSGRPLRNAVAYIEAGEIKAVQYKTLLPTYDVFDEDRYFEPATSYAVPQCNGWRIGLSICEDIWVSEHAFAKPRYLIDPIEKVAAHRPGFSRQRFCFAVFYRQGRCAQTTGY